MKIFTTDIHTVNNTGYAKKQPYGKLKTGREDPEVDALLARVSP